MRREDWYLGLTIYPIDFLFQVITSLLFLFTISQAPMPLKLGFIVVIVIFRGEGDGIHPKVVFQICELFLRLQAGKVIGFTNYKEVAILIPTLVFPEM